MFFSYGSELPGALCFARLQCGALFFAQLRCFRVRLLPFLVYLRSTLFALLRLCSEPFLIVPRANMSDGGICDVVGD